MPVTLTLTKAPESSTVHRAVPLDDVRVHRFDASGDAVGETRFVGLYTSSVYHDSIERIPVLRSKAAAVLARSVPGRAADTHRERALDNVLETLPRDELFRLPVDALSDLANGVVDVGERRRVRLFANADEFGRFVSCLVYLPRDRYTTPVRAAVVEHLRRAYDADTAEFSVLVGDSVMARLHVVLGRPERVQVDVTALEAELVELARAWVDELRDELQGARGEEEGLDAFRQFGGAFPPAYQADVTAAEAVDDIAVLEGLDAAGSVPERSGGDLAIRLRPGHDDDRDGVARLTLFRSGTPLVLSDVMPVLEQLDVVVVDERPYEIRPSAPDGSPGATRWIYSFGVHAVSGVELDDPDLQARVAELFLCVWSGAIENDGLNRLVVAAGLTPRDVVVLRALAKYLHQGGVVFTDATLAATLTHNPVATRGVLELFDARLDPASTADSADVDARLGRAIDEATSLDDDRILRALRVRRRGGGADQRVLPRARRRRPPRDQARSRDPRLPSPSPARPRDLGVRAEGRRGAPARRRHRTRRDPLVGPP